MHRPRMHALAIGLVALCLAVSAGPLEAQDSTPQSPACCGYIVYGTVFNDLNADGMMNGNDYGLSGWTVEVLDLNSTFIQSTTTGAGGTYSFFNPVNCNTQFRLREVVKAGWTRTFPTGNGTHLAQHASCSSQQFGPYDFGNTQSCPGFQKTYTTDADFNQGTLDGVVTNVNQLELSLTGSTFPFAWIANFGEGTISKVSTATGRELGRYFTGPPDQNGNYSYLQPSRTVVDQDGNCWVANRNMGGQASVTQIFATGGLDRNANSIIETSADAIPNGIIGSNEMLPWGQDERVARHYLVGSTTGEWARGMVIDKNGFLWVGLWAGTRVVKIDPNLSLTTYAPNQTPTAPPLLVSLGVAPHHPYGLALSPSGLIYGATGSQTAFEIDPGLASGGTGAGPVLTKYIHHPGANNYGIVVDRNCIVWLAKLSDSGGNYGCIRWNPSLTTTNPLIGWTFSTAGAGGIGRGITCDFNGNIWMSVNGSNFSSYVARYNNAGTWIANYPVGAATPVGIGVCSDGSIIVSGTGSGTWDKLNSTTGASIATGGPQQVGFTPYTYSDFTGSVQSLVSKQLGLWPIITDGGNASLSWTVVSWNSSTPPNTGVLVEARAAQSLPALGNQAWTLVATSGTLPNPLPGRYIETRVRLTRNITSCAPPFITPILYDLSVVAVCDTCHFQSCPPDTFVACQNPTGAIVNYTPPTLGAGCGPGWSISCTPPPGSFFPAGPTNVDCRAISAQGDTVHCYFTVTVTGSCATVPQGGCCTGSMCITTSEADCLGKGGIYLGDNTPCSHSCEFGCLKPPSGLTAWFPLDGGSGVVTPNLANSSAPGTLVGSPTPVTGQNVVGCYNFNGTSSYVTAPDVQSLDINAANFTIDAWVRLGNLGLQPICDKRDGSPLQGYVFFLVDGYPGIQLATGGVFTNFILNAGNGGAAAFVADNNWHLVAVTVERANPAGIQFYVDGIPVGTTFNPTAHQGLLASSVLFQIARSYPWLNSATYFNGMIDELEIFRRVLTGVEISQIYNANDNGKCRETCYATTLACCAPGGNTSSTITICNYSGVTHLYSFGLSPVTGVPGCTGPGAFSFNPASGTVSIAPGSCLTIPINVPCPTGTLPGQVSCYQVSVFNHDTGRLFGCIGSVKKPVGWCVKWVTSGGEVVTDPIVVTPGSSSQLRLVATYDEFGSIPAVFTYQISPQAGDTETLNDLISLNGLPPGTPIEATLVVPPDGVVTVDVDVAYTEEQPLGFDRLVARVDDDGDGMPEPVAEAGLRSRSQTTTGVDGGAIEAEAAPARSFIELPNPFSPSSRITFRIQGSVDVETSVGVYDLNGRQVKTFYSDAYLSPGSHTMDWDGTNNHGGRLEPGMYFVKIKAGELRDAAKFVLIR